MSLRERSYLAESLRFKAGEFDTMHHTTGRGFETKKVKGFVYGSWGIYKGPFGWKVIFIPNGQGLGDPPSKKVAMGFLKQVAEKDPKLITTKNVSYVLNHGDYLGKLARRMESHPKEFR